MQTGLILCMLYSGIVGTSQYTNSKKAQDYLQNNIARITQEQRDDFNLSDVGIPKLKFKLPKGKRFLEGLENYGMYVPGESEMLYFPTQFATSPEPSITKSIVKFLAPGFTHEIKDSIVKHELGHRFADKIAQKNSEIWPYYSPSNGPDRYHILPLLSEGIAESLSGGNNKQGRLYIGGHKIVNPIIKKFGEKGIEYLVNNSKNFTSETLVQDLKKAYHDLSND